MQQFVSANLVIFFFYLFYVNANWIYMDRKKYKKLQWAKNILIFGALEFYWLKQVLWDSD